MIKCWLLLLVIFLAAGLSTLAQPVIKIRPIDKRCVNGPVINLNDFVTVDGIFKTGGIWSSNSAGIIYTDKFNPMAAGVSSFPGWKVIYEYTDPTTGCYNKDSSYVTVYDLPNPFAGFDEDVCTGSKKALNGLPSQPPGTWRGTGVGGITPNWWFNPDTAGIINGSSYKLIFQYTDLNKCMNEDTVTYTVNAKPATPVITVSPSDSFLECVLSNGLYKWFYRLDFYTSPTMISYGRRIDPKLYCKNCYFGVIFTDSNGCVSDTSVWYYFSLNSINTNNRLIGFKIYPNPAKGEFYIEYQANESPYIMLTDIYGKTMLSDQINPGKNSISIKGFKPGIYILKLNNSYAYRLVIE